MNCETRISVILSGVTLEDYGTNRPSSGNKLEVGKEGEGGQGKGMKMMI